MDVVFGAIDGALRTLFSAPRATRPCPVVPADETHLGAQERQHAAALMRVNHVGEVCAQALYTAQALVTRDAQLKRQLERAAREETDHLAWTAQRIEELGSRGRMIGVVSHVAELAERVPVRYVVTKQGNAATVEKVMQ